MIAIDTNILVYAHRQDSRWHARAKSCLSKAAESGSPWAIPWPCVHEFLNIVTHPRIFSPPSPLDDALASVDCWLESETLVLLSEDARHWEHLTALLRAGNIAGPKVHDARVAALCERHGVQTILTADRDFGRFPSLKSSNPLVGD